MNRLQKIQNDLGTQEFRYTTDKGCLTLEQRKFYEENGYIVIKKFLKDDDIEKWKQRFLDYCDKKLQPYDIKLFIDCLECKLLRILHWLKNIKVLI